MDYWFVQLITKALSRILFSLEVEGKENIPERGAFIIAGNHCSNLDPPIIAVSVSRKLSFLAKRELFENKAFANILDNLNCIALDRMGIGKSVIKQSINVLNSGRGLLVFPEGTRSIDGKFGKGKAGVSVLAFASGAPVVPAFIDGTIRRCLREDTVSVLLR